MATNRRHEQIIELLARREALTAAELARRFNVNIVTVRRDLAALERAGRLHRTHGGAMAAAATRVHFEFAQKQQARLAEKSAIARAAVELIEPGMCVSLDTGTTTLALARRLHTVGKLRVLTSSLAIAAELHPHDNIELVLLGGTARKGSPDMAGLLTEENVKRFRVNLAFLGADAAASDGLFTTDAAVARVSAAMVAAAQSTVLVADSSKFAASAFVRFAEWKDIDAVVTDSGLSAEPRTWLRRCVGRLVVAPLEQRDE